MVKLFAEPHHVAPDVTTSSPGRTPHASSPARFDPARFDPARFDPAEAEADSIARAVTRRLTSDPHRCDDACSHGSAASRIRRRSAGSGEPVDGDVGEALRSGPAGAPLAPRVRRQMERGFGADLSHVRVHTGPHAADVSTRLRAHAFAHGPDVYFRDGHPDIATDAGRELMAHEIAHTLQDPGGSTRIRARRDPVFRPPADLDPITDWVAYSGGTSPRRSKKLKAIDAAVAAYEGSRSSKGIHDPNIAKIDAAVAAIVAWKATKKGTSYRDTAIGGLYQLLAAERAEFVQLKAAKAANEAGRDELHTEYLKMDAGLAGFARRIDAQGAAGFNVSERDKKPIAMALTKRNPDGTLSDEALDALDANNEAEQRAYRESAASKQLTIDESLGAEQIDEVMTSNTNPLSDRTLYPELLHAGAVDTPETTVDHTTGSTTFSVTHVPGDPNAKERIEALNAAVAAIEAFGLQVPDLAVYFPRFGRDLTVKGDCTVTVGAKIADAIFIPPGFFAVSPQNVGNPKEDTVGPDGTYKFLSTALGPKNALVHSIVHELGHALHYHTARSTFYDLSLAGFTGTTADGRPRVKVVQDEVSGYGAGNPREMVAEMFLAMVIGHRVFSDDLMEMYRAYGGPLPPGA